MDWQRNAWKLYKREHRPDFEIDWLILPFRQMHDQLLVTAQAGSGGPDIADVEVTQFPRFIKGEVLFHDLEPRLRRIGEWDNLYRSSATDPWTYENKVYGVGNELNACLLAYRWDVWEKADVHPDDIETWDDFAKVAARFHETTGNYLIDQRYDSWEDWWLRALQRGGGFFDEEGNPTIDNEISLEVFTWMQRSVADGWATLRPVGEAYNIALANGRIASQIGPAWQFSGFTQQNIPQTKGKWHVRPFPVWEPGGSRTATLGGTGVSISRLSDFPSEAMDFVLWAHTTAKAVLWDFDSRAVWQTYRPTFDDPSLTAPIEFFDGQRVGAVIEEVSAEINPVYTSPFWTEVTDAFVRLVLTPGLQNPSLDPQRLLREAQREAERLIDFGSA